MTTREMTTKGALTLGAASQGGAHHVCHAAGELRWAAGDELPAGRDRKVTFPLHPRPVYLRGARSSLPPLAPSTPIAFPAGQTVENNIANKNYENDGVWRRGCRSKVRKNTEK